MEKGSKINLVKQSILLDAKIKENYNLDINISYQDIYIYILCIYV